MHKIKKLRPKECSHSFGRSFFILYLGNPNQREEAKRNRAVMAELPLTYITWLRGEPKSARRSEAKSSWYGWILLWLYLGNPNQREI